MTTVLSILLGLALGAFFVFELIRVIREVKTMRASKVGKQVAQPVDVENSNKEG